MIYTPPALDAVDFDLAAHTPADTTPPTQALTSYSVPTLTDVDFALVSYTFPTFVAIDFELADADPGVNHDISPVGLANAQAFGSASLSGTVALAGFQGAQAFGTPALHGTIALAGIASGTQFGTPAVEVPPTVSEETPDSGGFLWGFDHELARRRRAKRKREEEEEEAKRIADEVVREIALLMQAQAEREAEDADLERLKGLVSQADQARAAEELSKSTLKAFNKAKANMDRYALLAFERALQKQIEEDEMEYIVLQLLLDD